MPHDPEAERRQALYEELIADQVPVGRRPTPADFRRRRLVAAVAVAALLLTGIGLATALRGGGSDPKDGTALAVDGVPLPEGYAWPQLVTGSRDPLTGAPVRYPSERAARTEVTLRALCAWWASWRDANAAGDRAGESVALAGHARVLDLVPRLEGGAGAHGSVIDEEDRLRREARAGRRAAIEASLTTNCAGPLAPVRAG